MAEIGTSEQMNSRTEKVTVFNLANIIKSLEVRTIAYLPKSQEI